ncbi:MAG: protease modulator HflC [Myxococcota bacterium]|nr:protease modulator HflC [Myxococcota bacterium]
MKPGVLLAIVSAAFVLARPAFYSVSEADQVVITRFGKPVGKPITTPGLQFKIPFVDQVNRFDKRFLAWDGDANQMVTADKKYIWVDTFARWRITDPLRFFEKVRNETGAQTRLDDLIDGATRTAVASSKLIEMVRSTNDPLDRGMKIEDSELLGENTALEKVERGRAKVQERILELAVKPVADLGIELLDVRIKRINYVQSVQRKVFDRMVSERQRIAAQYRSEGQGEAARIRGQMQKELKEIQSEAYKRAEEIKGNADAEATLIYAKAFEKDPEFYRFIKTLETYRKSFDGQTTLVLDANDDFTKYLGSSR